MKLLFALLLATTVAEELPITSTDVFISSGEASSTSINVMARCNNEADSEMKLWIDGTEMMTAEVTSETDYTHTFVVGDLSSNTQYPYQVQCVAGEITVSSEEGSFKTLPADDEAAAISFVWASCLAGQGWGRNPDFEVTMTDGSVSKGGYVVFDAMKKLDPDFAVFQGDMIYADNPIPAVQNWTNEGETLGTWINNPTKDFVATTLDEFRANWKYNHGDDKMQSFLSEVPIFVQWDDHEVSNNWYPTEILGEPTYENNTKADSLYEASLRALYEFNPIEAGENIYRSERFGKHLEIFFPDFRSYRDPNPENELAAASTMMGEEQLEWLKSALKSSAATWKLISSHDPIGIVTGGPGDYDSFGQENPDIQGREFELQELLKFIYDEDIKNVVSLTSDVHYASYVNMDPERAEGGFTDFKPLDEFAIGPVHAGSFGPNFIDTSFGSESVYENGPLNMGYERYANLAPAVYELQTFGYAAVTEAGDLEVKLMSIDGSTRFEKTLVAEEDTSATSPSGTDDESTDDGDSDDEDSNIANNVEDVDTLEDDLDSGCNMGGNSYLVYGVGVLLGISIIM